MAISDQASYCLRQGDRFIRLPEVKRRTGLARSTIYKKLTTKEFPKPVKMGTRCTLWLESSIEEWMSERVRASL